MDATPRITIRFGRLAARPMLVIAIFSRVGTLSTFLSPRFRVWAVLCRSMSCFFWLFSASACVRSVSGLVFVVYLHNVGVIPARLPPCHRLG